MRVLWCWRCKADMPMLEEEEFASVRRLYSECIKATKEFRQAHQIPLARAPVDQLFEPVGPRYEELTGMANCQQNAILHHRLLLYGPPCRACGKPLRTPKARLCGSCMTPVEPTLSEM